MLYEGQQILKIIIETNVPDLESYDTFIIKYIDPDGVAGQWNATANGTNIEYTFSGIEELKTGQYHIQPIIYSGGRLLPGDKVSMLVYPSI